MMIENRIFEDLSSILGRIHYGENPMWLAWLDMLEGFELQKAYNDELWMVLKANEFWNHFVSARFGL